MWFPWRCSEQERRCYCIITIPRFFPPIQAMSGSVSDNQVIGKEHRVHKKFVKGARGIWREKGCEPLLYLGENSAPGNVFLMSFSEVDECLSNPFHEYATCVNLAGSYCCKCQDGFFGNRTHCLTRPGLTLFPLMSLMMYLSVTQFQTKVLSDSLSDLFPIVEEMHHGQKPLCCRWWLRRKRCPAKMELA